MSDTQETLIDIANANIRKASTVRNDIVGKLTANGIPSDKESLTILLSTVDGMDRTAIQTMRLDGDAESRDINRQAIELAERMFDVNPNLVETRNYDDEMVDETIVNGTAELELPTVNLDESSFSFSEDELSGKTTSLDWRTVEAEQKAILEEQDKLTQ